MTSWTRPNPDLIDEASERQYVWLVEGDPATGSARRWADDVASAHYSGGPPPMVVYTVSAKANALVRAFPELIKNYRDDDDYLYSVYRFREETTGAALSEVTVKIDGRA